MLIDELPLKSSCYFLKTYLHHHYIFLRIQNIYRKLRQTRKNDLLLKNAWSQYSSFLKFFWVLFKIPIYTMHASTLFYCHHFCAKYHCHSCCLTVIKRKSYQSVIFTTQVALSSTCKFAYIFIRRRRIVLF